MALTCVAAERLRQNLVTPPAGFCRDLALKLQMAVVFDLVARLRIRFHHHHNDRNVVVTTGSDKPKEQRYLRNDAPLL